MILRGRAPLVTRPAAPTLSSFDDYLIDAARGVGVVVVVVGAAADDGGKSCWA